MPDLEFLLGDQEAYLYTKTKLNPNLSTAAFDLDHTLIRPLNNRKFPISTNSNDGEFYDEILTFFKSFSKTHNLVVISNQSGLQNQYLEVFKQKLNKISSKINLNILFLV